MRKGRTMKLTNLIWVLALAGLVAGCNSGSPTTNVRPPVTGSGGSNGGGGGGGSTIEPGCDPPLPEDTGACTTADNIAVYEELIYTDDDGVTHTCNEATSAIGSDCILGSSRSVPPIRGCGDEAGVVLACFPNCPADVIADAAACVALCVQTATEQITGSRLSDECAACSGDTVACGAAFCTNVCINDSNAPACIDCRCANDCIEPFDECSGLPPTTTCG